MKRKLLIFAIATCLVAIVYMLARQYMSLDELVAEETRLRDAISGRPWLGFFVGFVVYFALSLVPGTGGKAIVAGWLFGFWPAMVMVNVSLTAAAVITFLFSRYVFRDLVRSRFGSRLARVNRGLRQEGAYYVFAARVLHAPFTIMNYLLGVTRLRTHSFWWSTQLGMLPGNVLFVLAGDQMPSLQQFADEGLSAWYSPGLVAALVAISVLPLLLQHVVRRYRARRRACSET